jgi:hypothetical protein
VTPSGNNPITRPPDPQRAPSGVQTPQPYQKSS